jgi:glycerophosphoryl diester phosphodiesterase
MEQETRPKPLLIAHRGASGYAPEHTLAAYRLAIEQGADFVEQDIQITKDGVLVCLHDADLARTTNVAQVFPSRASERNMEGTGSGRRGWYVVDFTLAEIKQLDAGSWFNRENSFAANPGYVGLRVPTMKEVIESVGDRAGLYIELKHYPFYKSRGLDSAQKLVALLNQSGFDKPGRSDRIFIQSFSKDSLLRLQALAPAYKRVQLLPMEDPGRDKDSAIVTQSLAREIAAYAGGVGPAKALLKTSADVDVFHAAGLLVHPYTFRGPTTAVSRRPLDTAPPAGPTVRQQIVDDIRRFIQMGIDGGFTDYPALWREAVRR